MFDTEAEALANALVWAAIPLSEVVAWADEQVLRSDAPHPLIIDLALVRSREQAVSLLHSLSMKPDRKVASRILFGYFLKALRNGHLSYERISKALYMMALAQEFPDKDAEGHMWSFEDDLSLANQGAYGDPNKVKSELVAFLEKYAIKA